MEKLLEEISFDASNHSETTVSIDSSYVDKRLKDLSQREDLARYVL
jgi:ATP-dependent HslUV protease ATP-binding subunit HslU